MELNLNQRIDMPRSKQRSEAESLETGVREVVVGPLYMTAVGLKRKKNRKTSDHVYVSPLLLCAPPLDAPGSSTRSSVRRSQAYRVSSTSSIMWRGHSVFAVSRL